MELTACVVAVVAFIAGVVVVSSILFRDRWGVVPGGRVKVGPSPYREVEVVEMKPRGVPTSVRWAAGVSIAWGLATSFFFAPAGALFAVVSSEDHHHALGGAFVGLVSLEGFVLGIALIVAAVQLMKGALRDPEPLVRWSFVHHIAVAAVFFVLAALEGDAIVAWVPFVALPCALGVAQAMHIARTAESIGWLLEGDDAEHGHRAALA
jgi:hypothetical protein